MRYFDEEFDVQEAEPLEQNGNLVLIRDKITGEEKWICPHEEAWE